MEDSEAGTDEENCIVYLCSTVDSFLRRRVLGIAKHTCLLSEADEA